MTAAEFVAATILKATGKSSTASSGDTKWQKILGIGNLYIDTWQDEPDVEWNSLYTPDYSIGTVTATDTFELPDDVRNLSDERGDTIKIIHTGGQGSYTEYSTVPANQLKLWANSNVCAQMGRNLVFSQAFTTESPEFGGDIQVPVYAAAPHISDDSDTVPVDNPLWLVLMSAAEYVRNDITLQNQYPNLIAEANQMMLSMKDNNDAQISEVNRPWAAAGQTW